LPNKLDVVSRQLTRGDGVYIDGAVQDRRRKHSFIKLNQWLSIGASQFTRLL
jgi:hypothetical protein